MKMATGHGRSFLCSVRPQFLAAMRVLLVLGIASVLPAAAAPAADNIFGGWMLDRAASKLTHGPTAAEVVTILPWGQSGWVWNRIFGGRYQPEDLGKGIAPPQGDTQLPGASPSKREMYYASWDSKSYGTYGHDGQGVQLRKTGDEKFEVEFSGGTGAPENSQISVSADGKHLTLTTNDDVRVYNRIDPASWPGDQVEAAGLRGPGFACSGLYAANEQLTHRTRPIMVPTYEIYGPWGNVGWIQINLGTIDAPGGELVFDEFNNGKAYEFFAGDLREQVVRQIDVQHFETVAIRNGVPADKETVEFSPDCKRVTRTVAEGTDRRTGIKYYNDVRVFDRVDQ